MGGMTDAQHLAEKPLTLPPLRFGILALIFGNIFLSFGPWLVKLADTGPIASAFWRVTIAAPVLFLIARRQDDRAQRPVGKLLLLFAVSGAIFAADLAAWHIGTLQTKLANANLLGNSTSFLLPVWVFFATREMPTRAQAIALALAIIGAIVLMGRSYSLSPENFVGDLLCVLAGAFYTAYLVLMARARGTLGPWPVLAWSTLMCPVPLLLMALGHGEQIWPANWTPLILLALLSQILGQALMIYVIGRVSALLFGLTLLLQPIIGVIIGATYRNEWPAPLDWLGMIMIGVALVLVSLDKRDQ